MERTKKGFTLIELLIVIAILAVLSVAVILTLNPAELLRQARDSTRLSDMANIKSAMALYLADVTTPNLASSTDGGSTIGYDRCFVSLPERVNAGDPVTSTCAIFGLSGSTGLNGNYTLIASSSATDYRKTNSLGWIPVNFASISAGAPFGNLPVDPVNNGDYYYAYVATSTAGTLYSYKIDSRMESSKYRTVPNDVGANSNDGGTNNAWYETGGNLAL